MARAALAQGDRNKGDWRGKMETGVPSATGARQPRRAALIAAYCARFHL